MPKSSPAKSAGFRSRQALIAAANAGDADAQSRLGDVYREGDKWTVQDYAEAVRWYRAAAEQGDGNAQNNLGSMYWHGLGVPSYPATGVSWYRRAAEQDLATAQYNLVMAFESGVGVAQDLTEGATWLRRAAENGDMLALSDWGRRLRFGQGVAKDILASAEAFIAAAKGGDIAAHGNLCDLEAELREMAMAGKSAAAERLMEMFRHGLGVAKDRKLSYRWGKLWATLENVGVTQHLTQAFNRAGDLDYRYYGDPLQPAPGDDLYSWEWWYRNGTRPEDIWDDASRKSYVEYQAKRDAGTPPPF